MCICTVVVMLLTLTVVVMLLTVVCYVAYVVNLFLLLVTLPFIMSLKRKSIQTASSDKKRKVITLETKYEMIKLYEGGETINSISKKFDMSTSTVSTIMKAKEKFLAKIKEAQPLNSTWIRTKETNSLIPRMETLLTAWINDQTQRLHMPVSQAVICTKALSLFKDLCQKENLEESFVASNGWFQRYKKKANWHSIRVQGESASADEDSAKKFPQELKNIIEEGNFTSSQIFNVDETGLFWKRMPGRTFISKEESRMPGFKAAKDRLTLLLGGNAEGDCKLKPMLIYRSENPRVLKGVDKKALPVIWRSNKKAWVTVTLFEEWFSQNFIPEVKKFCEEKGIPFNILLLMDNAPSHPSFLKHLSPNIKVVFLPPNTTSLLQPMDQGVIAAFKAHYLRYTFEKLIEVTDREGGPSILEFWKSFSILDAVKIIKKAWEKVTQNNMKGVWKKLCPQFFSGSVSFEELEKVVQSQCENIVSIANSIHFDVSIGDIDDLLHADKEELTNDELIEMAKYENRNESDDEEISQATASDRGLSLRSLDDAFTNIENAIKIFEENDPNCERSSKVALDLRKAYSCYQEIYREKKKKCTKQLTLENFIKKTVHNTADKNLSLPLKK